MFPPTTSRWSLPGGLHRLLTHDFCPSANRWVYWIKRPSAALALAMLVAMACAVFVQPVAWLAATALLLVVMLGCLWPAITWGGAHFVLGDGSVRFVSEVIDIRLFQALLTISKNEVVTEF